MPATGGVPRSAHCGRPLHLARGFARSRAILVSAASCSPLEVSSQSGTSESLCGNWLVCEKAVLTDFAGKKHGDRVAFSAPTHEARRSANAVSPIRHSRPLRISVRSDQYPIDPLGAFIYGAVGKNCIPDHIRTKRHPFPQRPKDRVPGLRFHSTICALLAHGPPLLCTSRSVRF